MLTKEQIIANCKLCVEWYEADEKFEVEYLDVDDIWVILLDIPSWRVQNYLYRKKPQPKTRLLTQDDIINSSSPVWVKSGRATVLVIEVNSQCLFISQKENGIYYKNLKDKDIFISGKWQKGVMIDESI